MSMLKKLLLDPARTLEHLCDNKNCYLIDGGLTKKDPLVLFMNEDNDDNYQLYREGNYLKVSETIGEKQSDWIHLQIDLAVECWISFYTTETSTITHNL